MIHAQTARYAAALAHWSLAQIDAWFSPNDPELQARAARLLRNVEAAEADLPTLEQVEPLRHLVTL